MDRQQLFVWPRSRKKGGLMNAQIPQPETLDALSNNKWTDGIQIQDLKELDCLLVETLHHTYEITVIDPNAAEVLIRGGEFFPERTVAFVAGASLGGSFLKTHGIYTG